MKIYTKTGDEGLTSLFSGKRVPKNDELIEAYGTVDEVNSILGLVLTEPVSHAMREKITTLQHELFELGSDLATPWEDELTRNKVKRINQSSTERLETEMDDAEKKLPKLTQFILPGGTKAAGYLHLARTVCRRAERIVTPLFAANKVNPETFVYLNRLSDWCFMMARLTNLESGTSDVTWQKK